MKRRLFTLIELMTVMIIISILIGLLIPTILLVKRQAMKTLAKSQMNAIATAIRTYEATYGVMPIPDGWTDENQGSKYDDLMALLTNVKAPQTETPYAEGNTRSIRFLDVPASYTTKGYCDPWGKAYFIWISSDYSGEVVVPGEGTLYGTVFIESIDSGHDPVYSWK